MVDTNDEWITAHRNPRTAHRRKRQSYFGRMATEAAKLPLAPETNTDPGDIDLIILTRRYSRYVFPATACLVQDRLGAKKRAWGSIFPQRARGSRMRLPSGRNSWALERTKRCWSSAAIQVSKILDYRDRALACSLATAPGQYCSSLPRTAKEFWISSTMLTAPAGLLRHMPGGGSLHPLDAGNHREKHARGTSGRLASFQVRGTPHGKNWLLAC